MADQCGVSGRILLGGVLVTLLSCSPAGLLAAETTDRKVYTEVPTVARSINPGQGETDVSAADAPLPTDRPLPQWIWGADQAKNYFVRKTIPASVTNATLEASCDNKFVVFVNGQKVSEHSGWEAAKKIPLRKHMKAGEATVLTIQIINEGGPAAFIARIVPGETPRKQGEKAEEILTDASWEVADTLDATTWTSAKIVGKLGDKPYGNVFADKTPVDPEFTVLPGFQVERLFTVPKDELGSWVNIAVDPKGRLIVSDQGDKGLCRITPPAIGSTAPTKVERLDVKISAAQGLLFAFDSLYVCVNGGIGSGLYRVRDTNGDDQYDEVVKIKEFRGGGEHGPHALRLSPDGKSILVVCGNHTQPPFDVIRNAPPQSMGGVREQQLVTQLPENAFSRIVSNWDEDLLLPRQWDAGGHAVGVLAPGGWVGKTDPEGKTWELLSVGYRNQFDFDLNADGEMFVYDADMEWDFGSPWYRPTRVCHATSGSEFGWRSGTGKHPAYYADSLPEVVNIGPGSPVGVAFGYGTKFPAAYQKALYLCDWTFGTMYAIHITPNGASYVGKKEEFLSRSPLPLTDTVVGADGALYFTVGGRGTQSELYRVTYVGKDSTEKVDAKDAEGAELRALRRKIEAFHEGQHDPKAVADTLVPMLSHPDRFIRYAARVGLEKQPAETWQAKVLGSADSRTVVTGAIGLARTATVESRGPILAALNKVNPAALDESQWLDLLRAYQLTFVRLGLPENGDRDQVLAKLEPLFPGESEFGNRELLQILIALKSPTVVARSLPLLARERKADETGFGDLLTRNSGYGGTYASMLANQPDKTQIAFAFALRNVKEGWTLDERKAYFSWFEKARGWSGGNSYQKFLTNIDREAFENASEKERLAIEALGARKPYTPPPLPVAKGPGQQWTTESILEAVGNSLEKRDFKNGETMFAASRCIVCHRFGGDGGATGPDLTQSAGRFALKDLVEAIVDPSKVVSDQYKATVVATSDGKSLTGRVVSETGDTVTLLVDPENSSKIVTLKRTDIDEMATSTLSLMPKDLLITLNKDEVLDLLAYILSRGDKNHAMFRK
jgi:putative heme-binding domain-containing protein